MSVACVTSSVGRHAAPLTDRRCRHCHPRPLYFLQPPPAVATEAHARHAFTALAVISLKCKRCGQGLKGEVDAMAHATATGHAEFDEAK